MIKNIFLDIDNTILDFDKCAASSIKAGFKEYGLEFSEKVREVFTRINNGLWAEIERGTLTKQGLYDVRWNRIFEELGIEADGGSFEHTFKAGLAESAETVDGAHELLEYLAPRYRVCAASNGPRREQENRLARAKMTEYFDFIFTSEGVGAEKPDKAFFDGCFACMKDAQTDETVIIGDSPTADIDGGRAYGLTTIWYNHKGSAEKSRADFTVNKLADIVGVLETL